MTSETPSEVYRGLALGIALGLPLGAGVGLIFGNLPLGAGIGLAIGTGLGVFASRRTRPSRDV